MRRTIVDAFSDAGYVLGALTVVGIVLAVVHRYRNYKEAAAASAATVVSTGPEVVD